MTLWRCRAEQFPAVVAAEQVWLACRYHDARRVLDQLATGGVDIEDVTEQLEREGLAKFEKSWNELGHTIAAELHRGHPARQS